MTHAINLVREAFVGKMWLRVLALLIVFAAIAIAILPPELRSTIAVYAILVISLVASLFVIPLLIAGTSGWILFSRGLFRKVFLYSFGWEMLLLIVIHFDPRVRAFTIGAVTYLVTHFV
jgi:hypothetical protein